MNNKQHTLHLFDLELDALCALIQKIGGFAEQQLQLFILQTQSHKNVRDLEDYIDVFDAYGQVNQRCHAVIARLQPAACDLRLITGCLKIAYELKRAALLAKKLNELSAQIKPINSIYFMRLHCLFENANLSARMLTMSLDAFAKHDVLLAESVVQMWQGAEVLLRNTMSELIELIASEPQQLTAVINILTLANAIEQLCYHAKNIAEHVIYIEQGIHIVTPELIIEANDIYEHQT